MTEEEIRQLDIYDLTVILVYFAIVLFVGIWSSRRSKKESVGDYFLASRNMHWIPVGASLFASNIGSGHFIGLAGAGAASGVGVAGFELLGSATVLLLGWVFVPVYMSAGVYTMPEYLRKRFGGQRIRIYLSFLTLTLYIFTKISADLYAGALFIQLALNRTSTTWLYISIFILLGVAAVFTIAGGLTAVIWSDLVQTVLMLFGSIILAIIAYTKVGGYQKIIDKFPEAIAQNRTGNDTCGIPPPYYMHLHRSPYPGESDLPWTGMIFGLTINAIWYWCADQVLVQRTLASKNITHAKGGCILAAYLKLLALWLLVFPGMISRILFPNRVACADPTECEKICGSPSGCTNIAYVELVIRLMPPGLAGLMLAVMMAALMSSLTSIFNSASTIFTIDVWTRFRKTPSDAELVIVGRVFVAILVAISVIWIPVIQYANNPRLFDYIQSISAILAPSICTVYLLAIFWERTNEQGAFWGLMTGLCIGIVRFSLQFSFDVPTCGSDKVDSRPWFVIAVVGNIHYLHFSLILFGITAVVTVCVSLLTKPIPKKYLHRLTFWTRKSDEVRIQLRKVNNGDVNSLKKTSTSVQNGVGTSSQSEHPPALYATNEDVPKEKAASEFLHEDTTWRRVVNVNAIICFTIGLSIRIYYA